MSERSRVSDGYAWRGGRVVRMCGRCSAREWGGAGACGTDARYAEGARAMHVRRMPRRGSAGGCGADGSRRAKSKAAVRQPCSLSTFDSLKPMQSGFFGSRGLFPKKVLESGCGVKPRIYTFPHVGVRGAKPREYTLILQQPFQVRAGGRSIQARPQSLRIRATNDA